MLAPHKKRIFGPRHNGRRIRLAMSLFFVAAIAGASFSAGYYTGAEESKRALSSHTDNIAGLFIY